MRNPNRLREASNSAMNAVMAGIVLGILLVGGGVCMFFFGMPWLGASAICVGGAIVWACYSIGETVRKNEEAAQPFDEEEIQ